MKSITNNIKRFRGNGRKRLFLIFGVINFLLTNISLQILLLIIPTLFATIISQLINFLLGFYLYGKRVFKVVDLNNVFFKRYLMLAIFLWFLNFVSILFLNNFGINKNIAAFSVIPFLVLISYYFQNRYVFK